MVEEICMTLTATTAIQTGRSLYRVPDPVYLRITGATGIDFIQRQTTNDARLLKPERSSAQC